MASSLAAAVAQATSGNGVVQWDIRKERKPQELTKSRKRASTFEEVIANDRGRGGYFATCRMGTPGQNLTLQLDTGSSDIWVPDSQARVCVEDGTEGCVLGSCMARLPHRIAGNCADRGAQLTQQSRGRFALSERISSTSATWTGARPEETTSPTSSRLAEPPWRT